MTLYYVFIVGYLGPTPFRTTPFRTGAVWHCRKICAAWTSTRKYSGRTGSPAHTFSRAMEQTYALRVV